MRSVLKIPRIYLFLQYIAGGMSARRQMLEDYASVRPGFRVLDIGCGPGYVASYLTDCTYVGFDINERYIKYAQKYYGNRHAFHCQPFDSQQVQYLEKFDLVLMNGLIHHLPDSQAYELVKLSRDALKPNGLLLTLDGCYHEGQSIIARYLLDKDRGDYVREAGAYRKLTESVFDQVQIFIRSDFSRVPYTYIVMKCANV